MQTPIKIFSGRASRNIAHQIATEFGTKLGNESIVEFADGEFETVESIMQHLQLIDSELIEITPSWSEKIVRFLTKPAVAPLLMTLGFLGLLFEVKSPGIKPSLPDQ